MRIRSWKHPEMARSEATLRARTSPMGGALTIVAAALVLGVGCATTGPAERSASPGATTDSRAGQLSWADSETPAIPETLEDIRRSGSLRVLVHGMGASSVPRVGSPRNLEMGQAEMLGRFLNIPVRYVAVKDRADLLGALLEGRGDLVVAQLTRTPSRAARVMFSDPVRYVDEAVVVSAIRKVRPRNLQDLAKEGVWVRSSSSFAETLAARSNEVQGGLKIHAASEALDPHDLLSAVGRGDMNATVVDSDALETYQAYRDDVQVAFRLREQVPIAWAMRPDAEGFGKEVNRFIANQVAVAQGDTRTAGDLDLIQQRGVIRIAMPNNAASCVFQGGVPMGAQYELSERLARRLGVRLDVVVPRTNDALVPLVRDGHVDMISAWLTVTPERSAQVAFSYPVARVEEVLVQSTSEEPITELSQLTNREIHVRKSSSYWKTLEGLKDKIPGLKLVPVDEKLATEEIIDLVGRGEIPLTVADMDLFTVTSLLRRDMDSYMVVSAGGERAFAVRPGSDALLLEINEFVESGDWQPGQDDPEPLEVGEDAATEVARRRLRSWPEALKWNPGPVLDMAREFASQHDLDWRLLVAKSAVASGHEPGATSWPGARGIYQMNPQKARDLGMGEVNLRNGAMATAAASTWLARSYDALPDTIQPADRWPMALAGFRVGVEHIRDAMELADAMGFPSQKWEGGVARALRLLERPMYASNARHGYCPGADAVVYAEQVLEAYGQMVKMHPDGGFTSGSRGAVPTP